MQQLKAEMCRLNMKQEMEALDDWFELSEQERQVTLAMIRRLAAERRAKFAPPVAVLRLVVAA